MGTQCKSQTSFRLCQGQGHCLYHSRAQSELIKRTRTRSQAPCWRACQPSVEVAEGQPQGDKRGEASGPIGSQSQFSTLGFRGSGSQSWKEQEAHTIGPVSPKKRKTDLDSAFSGHDDTLVRAIESAIAKALQAPTRPSAVAGFSENVQSIRAEMEEIKNGQLQLTQLMNAVMAVLRLRNTQLIVG